MCAAPQVRQAMLRVDRASFAHTYIGVPAQAAYQVAGGGGGKAVICNWGAGGVVGRCWSKMGVVMRAHGGAKVRKAAGWEVRCAAHVVSLWVCVLHAQDAARSWEESPPPPLHQPSCVRSNQRGRPLPHAPQDTNIPIGQGQTISSPSLHALMLELLKGHLRPGARALDVGCGGCGPC